MIRMSGDGERRYYMSANSFSGEYRIRPRNEIGYPSQSEMQYMSMEGKQYCPHDISVGS